MTFEELMDYAISHDCSDVHITQGTNLAVRRYGVLHILDERPTAEEAQEMIYAILSRDEIARVEAGEDVDVGRMVDNGIRVRANVYHQRNNLACSIRLLMAEIPEFEALGLPEVIKELAQKNNGIILVTGPTGSGKTTTLSAIVDFINKNEAKHVITIEDPIEYIYPHNRAMIHQRELGRDVKSFSYALHSALREDMQATIRSQFAASIRGVISQQLLPTTDGNGRVLTTEIMTGTSAIRNLINEDKIQMIPGSIQSSHQLGMHTLNEDLSRLYQMGLITRKTAIDAAYDPQDLEKVLGSSAAYY